MKLSATLYSLILAMPMFLAMSISASVFAEPPKSGQWWHGHDQGWFFYAPDPPPEPAPAKQPEQPMVEQKPEMFTDRMKRLGEELKSRAIENPTHDNVLAYARYNKMMLDMSQRFGLAWQQVALQHPALMSNQPSAEMDRQLAFVQEHNRLGDDLRAMSSRYGMFFFYSTTCPYCIRQSAYLRNFADKYGYRVKPVSLDGAVLPEWPDTVPDNGMSVRMNVQQVPSILVYDSASRSMRTLSSGIVTTEEIEQRLLWLSKDVLEPGDAAAE